MGDIYSDLLIRIRLQDNTSEAYSVEAQLDDGTAGVFHGELRLDHDRLTATRSDPVEYGLALFDTLFTGDVRRAYDEAFGEAGQGMRVRLWIDDAASELHALAWEGIYHMRAGQPAPLFLSCLTPFSRYADLPLAAAPPVPSLEMGRPVRMLFALSSPSDLDRFGYARLDADLETEKLRASIGGLEQNGLLAVRVMAGRTGLSSRLREELAAKGYEIVDGPTTPSSLIQQTRDCHIVHLVCHGVMNPTDNIAGLVLEDDDGKSQILQDQDLLQTLGAAAQLPQLFFLANGDSPRVPGETPLARLGRELVRSGIPAVVVMQDAISIESASLFTSAFYDKLLRHGYVDKALSEARLYLFSTGDRTRSDWWMPVLFTTLKTGQLISFEKESLPSLPYLLEDVQFRAVSKSAVRSAGSPDKVVTDLTQRLRHLAENLRQLHILVDLANQLRQIQEGFNPCVMLVQQAGMDLVKIQVAPLTWVWQPVRNNSLKRLQLFVQQYTDLRVDGWFPPLLEQAEIIDSSLNDFAIGALAKSVTTFNRQLSEAEPAVRQQLDQAIAELISFSDQTLGRLDIG